MKRMLFKFNEFKFVRYLLFLVLLFIPLTLCGCDDNIDLENLNLVATFNNKELDLLSAENEISESSIYCLKINLEDLVILNDWKEDYDLENMTSDEIDQLIRTYRKRDKEIYTNYIENFIQESSLNDLNCKIEYSKYAPFIYLEYSNFNDLNGDVERLNIVLSLEEVRCIELYTN